MKLRAELDEQLGVIMHASSDTVYDPALFDTKDTLDKIVSINHAMAFDVSCVLRKCDEKFSDKLRKMHNVQ